MPLSHHDFPALEQYLGAYLHQDWHDDYSSTEMGFQHFLEGEPRYAGLIEAELIAVLTSGQDEVALEKLVLDCGSFYLPSRDGKTTAAWLSSLLEMVPRTTREGTDDG